MALNFPWGERHKCWPNEICSFRRLEGNRMSACIWCHSLYIKSCRVVSLSVSHSLSLILTLSGLSISQCLSLCLLATRKYLSNYFLIKRIGWKRESFSQSSKENLQKIASIKRCFKNDNRKPFILFKLHS